MSTTLRKNRIKTPPQERVFEAIVYLLLIFLVVVTLVPVMQVVTISLSSPEEVGKFGLHLWPKKVSFEGYRRVLQYGLIWQAYLNTLVRTGLGVGINIVLLILGAYPLSKAYLPNKRLYTVLIIITMYFSGGLIPSYILITKYLALKNTVWALVLPMASSGYNLIVVRNFFMSIPESLEESARLDGAGDFTVLLRIVVPLSKPVLATVSLWCLVAHWNAWFDCMLYIETQSKYMLQYVLRMILLQGQVQDMTANTQEQYVNLDTMKMATVVVATLPIVCVYPFLQKYFVKGVMIGAVKG
jgi:putative aldouronate transport system permease protein